MTSTTSSSGRNAYPVKRTPRRLVLATGALLLLTGCGGTNQVRAGAAALIGTERITTTELQAIVERGLADPQAAQQLGADRAAYQRQALSRLINSAVLEEAADAQGVEVTQGEVAEQLELFAGQAGGREALEQQAAQSGIAPEDLEPFVRSIVLDQQLGDALTEDVQVPAADLQALYQENIAMYDRVRTRHILVPEEATARTILGNVTRDRARFAPLAVQFSTDTSNKDKGGDLGLAGRGQFVPEFENAVFGAKTGDVVLVQTQFGWHVVEVLERQTTTLAEAEPELRRTALQAERQAAVQSLLQETSADLGIKVNPRFGTYNSETGQVEPIASANDVLTPNEGQAPPAGPAGEAPTGGAPVEEPAPSPAG
ncbi:MAG: foldase [Frankiales bacterium]|nr:foldase [Frankiales bacterium]